MEGEGFEPSKAEPSDLQSDPFNRSGTPPNETSNCEGIALISQCAFLASCIFSLVMRLSYAKSIDEVVVGLAGLEPATKGL